MKRQLGRTLTTALLGIVTLVMVAPKTASAVDYQAVGFAYTDYQMAAYYETSNPAYPPGSAYSAAAGFGLNCAYAQYHYKLAEQQYRLYAYNGDTLLNYYIWLAYYGANLYQSDSETADWVYSYYIDLAYDELNAQYAIASWVQNYYIEIGQYYWLLIDFQT